MATRQHSEHKTAKWDEPAHLAGEAVDTGEAAERPPFAGAMRLSDSQLEILNMLEERPTLTATGRVASATAVPSRRYGVDVAFATFGCLAIGTGIAMLFFFAALGSVLLVSGAILCAVAFEHVALIDAAAEGARNLEQAANAGVHEIKPFL